jgi:dinuclear metal center YbgI/SA1388 family protein
VAWLNEYLPSLPDASLNGLQVEGSPTIHKIGAAVDGAQQTFEAAQRSGVDFLIVHHGLFWGKPFAIAGHQKKRLDTLFSGGINLYCSHLPLDAHPEVGNNAVMARELGLQDLEALEVGWIGNLPQPKVVQEINEHIQQLTGTPSLLHDHGPQLVRRIGIVSGGAAKMLGAAKAQGADLFITGEPEQPAFHEGLELGLNVIYAGHYASETFGVKALAVKLEQVFGLPWVFLDYPTGI